MVISAEGVTGKEEVILWRIDKREVEGRRVGVPPPKYIDVRGGGGREGEER